MPGYVERVGSLMTPQFRVGFEQSVTLAEQAVAAGADAYAVKGGSMRDLVDASLCADITFVWSGPAVGVAAKTNAFVAECAF